MANKQITYNIPGCGNLTANLFDYTAEAYSFLNHFKHIERFRRINQLGNLRDLYQGAHHNRYEYVFLQLSVISELCKNKNSELGLSAERKHIGKIKKLKKFPSSGEILQCLVLVSNMGYLEGTYATSRAWVSMLKNNPNLYNGFRLGLSPLDRPKLDLVIKDYEFYKFNYFMALFQLQRYKRKDKELVDFLSSLIRLYLNDDERDIQIIQLKKLFDRVRQISFLTLDSFYAPVPFSLDLASIFLTFESLYESIFIKNTNYKHALSNLELVLQDSVYMSSDACLNTSKRTQRKVDGYNIDLSQNYGITEIKNLLDKGESNLGDRIIEPDWIRERKLVQDFNLKEKNPLADCLLNQVVYEQDVRKKIGVSIGRVSLINNPKKRKARFVIGLLDSNNIQALNATLKSVNEAIKLRHSILTKSNYYNQSNDEQLMHFILKSIFGWEKRFILENKVKYSTGLFITAGRVELVSKVKSHLKRAEKILSTNEAFEVSKMIDLIEHVSYSGLSMAYVGSIRLFELSKKEESAEFDGILILPTKSSENVFAYVLEAKNQRNGASASRRQLENRVTPHLIPELKLETKDLNRRSAFAEISKK